eukprot:GHRR01003593.1.p1 GENE.GHRR01003593.1~~GHRR01003593.1.p1  ORF type:complete len:369 (+),score=124.57 GHRR01003593.1:1009-2115(+)
MSAVLAGAAAVGSLVALYIIGSVHFVDNACHNLETILPQQIVGQELALGQLTDAVCHHLSQKHPKKPLVVSVHGPPGVGKTYTHLWLARALYNKKPSAALQCPGLQCKGYKVVYGVDYLLTEASTRLAALKSEVVGHLKAAPDALLVVEEYDKADCAARGLWRQLLQHPERANITNNRAIILMESNLGMAELEEMLTQLGDRDKVTAEAAERVLRDAVFAQWRASQCESFEDTAKLMSLIDAFLPYLPLERHHMPQLVQLALQERRELLQQRRVALEWQERVPPFLAGKVEFSGDYPLDGAKVIDAAITRQVARPMRRAVGMPGCTSWQGCTITLTVQDSVRLKLVVRNNTSKSKVARPSSTNKAIEL